MAPSLRRPSAALVVALLALFVALGGPAEAARLIGSKQVKNRSLQTEDLSRKAVKTLQRTPPRSVGEPELADAGVTTPKLGDGAVTAVKSPRRRSAAPSRPGRGRLARAARRAAVGGAQLADGAVNGAKWPTARSTRATSPASRGASA